MIKIKILKYFSIFLFLVIFLRCSIGPSNPTNYWGIGFLDNPIEFNYVHKVGEELTNTIEWYSLTGNPYNHLFVDKIWDDTDKKYIRFFFYGYTGYVEFRPNSDQPSGNAIYNVWDLALWNSQNVIVPTPLEHIYYHWMVRKYDNTGQDVDSLDRYIPIQTLEYDFDADYISNAVELENYNVVINGSYHYDSNTNNSPPLIIDINNRHNLTHDYSIAKSTDQLINGLRIADQSTGYQYFWGGDPPDTDNWGTLTTINVLERVGRIWYTLHSDYPITYLDISLQYGGQFGTHVGHKKGIDVDMRYMSTTPGSPITIDDNGYDRDKSRELMLLFDSMTNVTDIFTEDTQLAGLTPKIKYDTPHRDHFHVRINPIFGIE